MSISNLLAVILSRANHFSVGTQERILFCNQMCGWFVFPIYFVPQPSCVRVQYHEILDNLEKNKKNIEKK